MIDVWLVSKYSSRFRGFKGEYRWDRKLADQKLLEIKTNVGHEKTYKKYLSKSLYKSTYKMFLYEKLLINPSLIYRKCHLTFCKFQENRLTWKYQKIYQKKLLWSIFYWDCIIHAYLFLKRGSIKHFFEAFIFKRIFTPVFD